MNLRKFILMTMLLLLLTSSLFIPLAAQDETIITIGVQEWTMDVFTSRVFEQFQADHPGVKVVVVPLAQDSYFPPAIFNQEESFEGAQKLASAADVLMISDYQMSITSTRQGVYLDMAPLVAGDSTLNQEDFFPALWPAFQWDRGIWALPISASMNFLIYDADAFDEAGLSYPTSSWTLDDLSTAARALTQYDANGAVTRSGFATWDNAALLRALLGRNFYDDNAGLVEPNLTQPELVALLEQWQALTEEGVFGGVSGSDYDAIPITTNGSYRLGDNRFNEDDRNWQGTLLPGGLSTISTVDGIAISAGTQHPELAYELAKYMTTNVEIVYGLFGDTPARQSMVGVEPEDRTVFRSPRSEEAEALVEQAVSNILMPSHMLFKEEVNWALGQMDENGNPALIALQDVQVKAQEILQAAADSKGQEILAVITPVPTPVLTANEIALNFRLSSNVSPLPNREGWDQLIADFIASDPEVGHIELLTGFNPETDEVVDCYYQSYSPINENSMEDPPVLNIDPFLDADPNFNRNDMLPGTLESVQFNNQTWGLPIVIEPQVLWYDANAFTQANAFDPANGWSITEFVDALQMLRSAAEDEDTAVFMPSYSPGYMNMLIAAFGSIPYDTSTNPPTVNINDPATMEAIRQALDLAKEGYIQYMELGGNGGGGMFNTEAPIQMENISSASWRLSGDFISSDSERDFRLTTFPIGSQYTPVSYLVGAGYIDADTLNPEACYRLLSSIAQRPDLLGGMPASRSLLNTPAVIEGYNPILMEFFSQFDATLSAPNTLLVDEYASSSSYSGAWIEQMWINQAFDHYVMDDANLEQELTLAEENITAYRQCHAGLGEFDPGMSEEESLALFRQMADCAIAIDPAMADRFFFPEDE